MTPDEIREHATTLISDHARDVEPSSIWEHLTDNDVPYTSHDVTAISELIHTAAVTVGFPGAASGDARCTGTRWTRRLCRPPIPTRPGRIGPA